MTEKEEIMYVQRDEWLEEMGFAQADMHHDQNGWYVMDVEDFEVDEPGYMQPVKKYLPKEFQEL